MSRSRCPGGIWPRWSWTGSRPCKTYQGAAYTDASPLAYLERARESDCVHPETFRQLHFLLTMLAEKGEDETFCFIREVVLTGREFALT